MKYEILDMWNSVFLDWQLIEFVRGSLEISAKF